MEKEITDPILKELDTKISPILKDLQDKNTDVDVLIFSVNKKSDEVLILGYGCRGCLVETILERLDKFNHESGRPVKYLVAKIVGIEELLGPDAAVKYQSPKEPQAGKNEPPIPFELRDMKES